MSSSLLARLAMLLVPLLIVASVAWLMRFEGVQRTYRMQAATLQALEQAFGVKALGVQGLPAAQEALADSKVQLQDARWRLAAGQEMSDLLDQLARLGHAHGLLIEQVDVGEPSQAAGYLVAPLQLQVIGNYPALRAWLDDWLGQIRLLHVSTLQLAAADQPGMLRLRLHVQAFDAGQQLPAPTSLAHEAARQRAPPARVDPFQAWSARSAADGLARVPLAQLQMVGSLARDGQYQALVWWSGRLYRVRAGDPLGRDQGVVVRVDERQMEVREQVLLGGAWQERSTLVGLRKPVTQGGMDEARTTGNAAGDGSGDARGASEDLSG
ncbi:pilus assembly protein PilP [Pseudomonas sp. S07E 245]|uniref:pilus assembly protein PilP n=1 Tax=Pseudomonas sp. S07E 245 TaxID=2866278 RepID=UPI001C72EA32|nr:pilus assembly protein PilP [Pseudomonas sp. S07E 245]QYX52093.1 pilus assembly protein PilP [Pseudomonas sp. S07E 245]